MCFPALWHPLPATPAAAGPAGQDTEMKGAGLLAVPSLDLGKARTELDVDALFLQVSRLLFIYGLGVRVQTLRTDLVSSPETDR